MLIIIAVAAGVGILVLVGIAVAVFLFVRHRRIGSAQGSSSYIVDYVIMMEHRGGSSAIPGNEFAPK